MEIEIKVVENQYQIRIKIATKSGAFCLYTIHKNK